MSGTRYEKEWRILYVWDPMQKAGGAASLYDLILIYHGGGGGGGLISHSQLAALAIHITKGGVSITCTDYC